MEVKVCKGCGAEKPLTEFYRHRETTDGLRGKCKSCINEQAMKWAANNKDRVREIDRNRYSNDTEYRDRQLKKRRNQRIKFRELENKKTVEYKANNPDKNKAHFTVYNKVKQGKLIRQVCEVCGSEKVHAHHDDYSKPLEVRWLCPKHHKREHWK